MEDSYVCDRCGDEYFFINAYDEYKDLRGCTVYMIQGWYGIYDGQQMCEICYDSY